jgi:hypothetical protein
VFVEETPQTVSFGSSPLSTAPARGDADHRVRGFPDLDIREAPPYCERHLEENYRFYISHYQNNWENLSRLV